MNCVVCSEKMSLSRSQARMFPKGSLVFCSFDCLGIHVSTVKKLDQGEWDSRKIFSIRSEMPALFPVWSTVLQRGFRSDLERRFAEGFAGHFKTTMFYETQEIQVAPKKSYIPDFWLARHDVWLEVKGEWRIGGRKKFEEALRILGPERLILLPPVYEKWFRGRA